MFGRLCYFIKPYTFTAHFFAIFAKKTLPWKPLICDAVHSDVQVRMRDSKPGQNFMQEKDEKLY